MNRSKSLKDPHNVSILWRNPLFPLAFQSGYGQLKQQSHTTVPSEFSLSPIQTVSAWSRLTELLAALQKLPLAARRGPDGAEAFQTGSDHGSVRSSRLQTSSERVAESLLVSGPSSSNHSVIFRV